MDSTTEIDLGAYYYENTALSVSDYNLALQENKFITLMYEDVGSNLSCFDYYTTNYDIDDYSLFRVQSTAWTAVKTSSVPPILSPAAVSPLGQRRKLFLSNLNRPDSAVWGDSIFIAGVDNNTGLYRGEINPDTGKVDQCSLARTLPAAVEYPAIAINGDFIFLADSMSSKKICSAALDSKESEPSLKRRTFPEFFPSRVLQILPAETAGSILRRDFPARATDSYHPKSLWPGSGPAGHSLICVTPPICQLKGSPEHESNSGTAICFS